MDATDIISALGGRSLVAEGLGIRPNAVTQWRQAGIPARYWPPLARLAARTAGAEHITLEVLEKHTKPGFFETEKAPNSAMATEAYADAVHAQASEAV